MSLFPVFSTAASGFYANRVWMDAISDNIANVNTVRPFDQAAFQTRWIQVQSVRGDNNDPVVPALRQELLNGPADQAHCHCPRGQGPRRRRP